MPIHRAATYKSDPLQPLHYPVRTYAKAPAKN